MTTTAPVPPVPHEVPEPHRAEMERALELLCDSALDPIVDMGRTALNVSGQALIPALVASQEGILDRDRYLAGPGFASRLPETLRAEIRAHGIRNSHLVAIAPTGTISLAFADNASNGIEPPFSWSYTRKKRMPDNSFKEYAVEDHAWRLYRHLHGADAPLTDAVIRDKFAGCGAMAHRPPAQKDVERLWQAVQSLETISVREFAELLPR